MRGSIWPPLWFSKNASFQERAKAWFFVTLNIIISHTFPENFIEITQVVQKILSLSLSIFLWLFLAIFIIFLIFWHFLVTKKRMMTAYNRWCQHFFHFQRTSNKFCNNCKSFSYFFLKCDPPIWPPQFDPPFLIPRKN